MYIKKYDRLGIWKSKSPKKNLQLQWGLNVRKLRSTILLLKTFLFLWWTYLDIISRSSVSPLSIHPLLALVILWRLSQNSPFFHYLESKLICGVIYKWRLIFWRVRRFYCWYLVFSDLYEVSKWPGHHPSYQAYIWWPKQPNKIARVSELTIKSHKNAETPWQYRDSRLTVKKGYLPQCAFWVSSKNPTIII